MSYPHRSPPQAPNPMKIRKPAHVRVSVDGIEEEFLSEEDGNNIQLESEEEEDFTESDNS
jgi:hypothetical protein